MNNYDLVIKIAKDDKEQLQKAYFNRGNSKYNMKDLESACKDWTKAKELGAEYANDRINQYCTK